MKKRRKRKLPRVLIILADGKIDYVYSNTKVKYAIVDYDKKYEDINPVLCVEKTDTVNFDLKELYAPDIAQSAEEESEYHQIYKKLSELGF